MTEERKDLVDEVSNDDVSSDESIDERRRQLIRAGWTVPIVTSVAGLNFNKAFATSPHGDAGHADTGTHGDGPIGPPGHTDVPHDDGPIIHFDTGGHSDVVHVDTGGHSDIVHIDGGAPHIDTPVHIDTPIHIDVGHIDLPF